jgi:hypothetical protein
MGVSGVPDGHYLNLHRVDTLVLVELYKKRWYGDKLVDAEWVNGLDGFADDEIDAAVQGKINVLLQRYWLEQRVRDRIDHLIERNPHR